MNDLPLSGRRVLILLGEDYEDLELQYPKYRLIEAGAAVTVGAMKAHHTYHGKHGYPQTSDDSLSGMHADNFDALVIPGGWMPDKLRRSDEVKALVRTIAEAGKPIASICHGPLIDISAEIVKGRTYTSSPGVKDDLVNAGATWVDRSVCVDGNRVSARRPDDLPDFCRAFIEVMVAAE